jgi:hypothetical protein
MWGETYRILAFMIRCGIDTGVAALALASHAFSMAER